MTFVPDGYLELFEAISRIATKMFDEDTGLAQERLRQWLFAGSLTAHLFDRTGEISDVPQEFWGSDEAVQTLKYGRATIFQGLDIIGDGIWLHGTILIREERLKNSIAEGAQSEDLEGPKTVGRKPNGDSVKKTAALSHTKRRGGRRRGLYNAKLRKCLNFFYERKINGGIEYFTSPLTKVRADVHTYFNNNYHDVDLPGRSTLELRIKEFIKEKSRSES